MRFNPSFDASITADIQNSERSLQSALQNLSTGKRVNLSSDDPAASATLVHNLTRSANNEQYTANASSALSQAQAADSVLTSVVSLLNQAVTLGIEGANANTLPENRQEISIEIQGLLQSLVAQANTTYQGVSLFGGTANGTAAFSLSSAGVATYNGNSGINSVSVGETLEVQLNVPGDTLFMKSGSSAMGALEQLVTALAGSGTTTTVAAAVTTATTEVVTALNYVSQQHVIYGNTINQLSAQEAFLAQERVTLTSQQNLLVGIDTATAAAALTQAEFSNTAVLEAAGKVLPTSLLHYLSG